MGDGKISRARVERAKRRLEEKGLKVNVDSVLFQLQDDASKGEISWKELDKLNEKRDQLASHPMFSERPVHPPIKREEPQSGYVQFDFSPESIRDPKGKIAKEKRPKKSSHQKYAHNQRNKYKMLHKKPIG